MFKTLYRGITVKPEDLQTAVENIRDTGLTNSRSYFWKFSFLDLRPRIEELFNKPDLTTHDTHPTKKVDIEDGWTTELVGDAFSAICACGDMTGASYYALVHNQFEDEGMTCGLVITFRAEIEHLLIDGRDFLANCVFRDAGTQTPKQREMACRLFGDRLGRYYDRAAANSEDSYRNAMYDLAVQDNDVVLGHLKNETMIGGRHGVVFRSAFFVRTPISPFDIIAVEKARQCDFTPDITVERFRRMGKKNERFGVFPNQMNSL